MRQPAVAAACPTRVRMLTTRASDSADQLIASDHDDTESYLTPKTSVYHNWQSPLRPTAYTTEPTKEHEIREACNMEPKQTDPWA